MYLNLKDRQGSSCPPGTQCSSSTTTYLIPRSTPSPTTQNANAASTTSAAPSETTTVVVDTSSPSTLKGPIIAGVICGIVVLAILTAMLWFFCRRRRQINEMGRSSPLVGSFGSNGNEKFAMDHSIDEEAQRHSGGIFAPFGGYRKTPSVNERHSSDHSLNNSLDISNIQPTNADIDAPIPDPEKSTLVAPPDHEHPAYHPMPGQAPDIPVYSRSQHSAHPSSRSASVRDPAYNSLPSQSPKRSKSYAQPGPAYDSLPSQPPEPTYDPRSQHLRAPLQPEPQSPTFSPIKISVPEESPELPALTFSPISLDTNTNNTPGTTYNFPSPSEMAPIPAFTSPTDADPSMVARFPSPSQVGASIEPFRPTPLTENEVAEIGTSLSPFRPTPLSEAGSSGYPFRSPPQPTEQKFERTEYPFQTPPMGTSSSEQPGFTPLRTPSLSRAARELTHRRPSIKGKGPEIPPMPPLPNPDTLPSPTPPPLKFKKRSADRSDLPPVATTYTPPKKPTPAKDLPFNYISLPSPQSPSSPSAIQAPTSAMDAIARTSSAVTTYSIPIGLSTSHKRKNTANSGKTVVIADEEVRLTHNHSREWSESDREHVMSWATYKGADSPLMEGDEMFSPIIEQVARAETVERLERVEQVRVQGRKLFKSVRPPPQEELRQHELDGRELKRKSPQQDLRERAGGAKEGKKSPENLDLDQTSRINEKEKKGSLTPKQEKRDSLKSEKAKGSPRREDVSPLFSPIPAGHKFSPLSPQEKQWAGQI